MARTSWGMVVTGTLIALIALIAPRQTLAAHEAVLHNHSCPGGGSADAQVSAPKCDGPPPRYRTFDGSCYKADGVLGMAGTPYSRIAQPAYADGSHSPRAGTTAKGLPNPRDVTNLVHPDVDAPSSVTHFFMSWAQLVAHDITQSVGGTFPMADAACCKETASGNSITETCMRIDISKEDPFFGKHGVSCLGGQRSTATSCGTKHREQTNMVSHFMDLSIVYGSSVAKANGLRALKGGLLKSRTVDGEEHFAVDEQGSLLAGDHRFATPILFASQTALLREHNRVATALAGVNPQWDDERLFQEARRVVIAQMQQIAYRDWLPLFVGEEAMKEHRLKPVDSGYSDAYDEATDPRTVNEFVSAVFRIMHSVIQNKIWFGRTGADSVLVTEVPADVVMQPGKFLAVVEGAMYQPAQEPDQYMAFQLTNRVMNKGKPFGGDLISTNILRGREHGVPSYNEYRSVCNMSKASDWAGFSDLMSAENIEKLKSLYASVDDVDFYVGGLLERREGREGLPPPLTPPLFRCVAVEQFRRWKEGDPYFFDLGGVNRFTPGQLDEIRKQTAAKIMCDHVPNLKIVPRNPFVKLGVLGNEEVQCGQLPVMDFSAWKE